MTRTPSPSHTRPWPPCESLPSTTCFCTLTHPYPPTFLMAPLFSSQTFSRMIPQHFSSLVHSTHNSLPMKMGQNVPKHRHINFRHLGITQKKTYNIQNMAEAWNQEYFTSIGRKLQDTSDYSKNSASRKPNSSPPLLSSFAAEITTTYLVSYSSITTPTPELPNESINTPVLPYSRKGYITTDENLTTHLENCWKYTYV